MQSPLLIKAYCVGSTWLHLFNDLSAGMGCLTSGFLKQLNKPSSHRLLTGQRLQNQVVYKWFTIEFPTNIQFAKGEMWCDVFFNATICAMSSILPCICSIFQLMWGCWWRDSVLEDNERGMTMFSIWWWWLEAKMQAFQQGCLMIRLTSTMVLQNAWDSLVFWTCRCVTFP